MGVGQHVAEENAARGEGEREGHEGHGSLRGAHTRLAQHDHAVGDRLDAGVGAAAEGVGAQQNQDQRQPAHRVPGAHQIGVRVVKDGG